MTDTTPTTIEVAAEKPFRVQQLPDSLHLLECQVDGHDPSRLPTWQVALVKPPDENVVETLLYLELDGLEVPGVTLPVYAFGHSGK
ncbi:MAG: hypothetical protein KatS3mg110_3786 [Pirellulaceae bacterium]|nr:MAG: hypothetical protein KatS3mg110_3773 [Pirellulaceae bacterium]GIW95745.1 MAG: hypothetical protein KatS3mg110_3786 [Pirellulaceae bacterium]